MQAGKINTGFSRSPALFHFILKQGTDIPQGSYLAGYEQLSNLQL